MDRNNRGLGTIHYSQVALRKESVDRNLILPLSGSLCCVALRKESVDRNHAVQVVIVVMNGRSP